MDATTGAIQHTAYMVPNGCIGRRDLVLPGGRRERRQHLRDDRDARRCTPGELAPSIVKLRASDLTILSSWTVPSRRSCLAIPTSAPPRRSSPPPSTASPARSSERSTRTASSTPGTGPTWPPDRCGSRRSPIPPGARCRSSRPSWDGSRLYVGGRQHDHQRHELLREHLRARPGDRRVPVADCVQRLHDRRGSPWCPGVLIEGYGAVGKLLS